MPMVRAMRLLNSIEAGTTSGAQLEAQLINGGVQSDFNSIMQLPGQCSVLAASLTALNAINLSPIATGLTANSSVSNLALSKNSGARAYLFSSATNLLTACVVAAPQNWYPYGTWTRAFGAGLNNNVLGPSGYIGTFMAYGNGVYVSIYGYSSRNVYTSPDGITWTLRTNALPTQAGGYWMGVAFGNGVFIAVSGGNATSTTAAVSTDGITWTAQTLPLAQWTNIACGLVGSDFTWVAISGGTSNSGTTARSIDNGATWTAGGSIGSLLWTSIAYGNGRFITVSGGFPWLSQSSGSSAYYTTNGGVSWTYTGLPDYANWTGVVNNPNPTYSNYWTAVNSSGYNQAYSSNNGVTWNTLGNYADGNTWWIAATPSGLVTYNRYTDISGTAFYSQPGTTDPAAYYGSSTVYANGAVRMLSQQAPYFLTYSTPNASSTGVFYGISGAFKPTCTLTVNGVYYLYGYAGYYSSTDQTNWTFTVVPAFASLGGPVSVAYNGTNTFVAVFGGANGATQNNNQFARSTDNGATWSFVTVPRTTQWTSIAYGNGVFVAVAGQPNPSINGGSSASSNEGVYSSNNGASWTVSNLPSTSQWSHIAFLNGSFAVVGNAGQVYYSTTNGSSFSAGASYSTNPGRQIAFGVVGGQNTWCVVSSNNSTVNIASITGSSHPTTTSTNTTISSETQMSSITYNNGYFFAATNYATGNSIYSSVNGTTWTKTSLPTTSVYPSNFLTTTGSTGVVYYNTTTAASNLGTYNI